jgi:hypothetical protein
MARQNKADGTLPQDKTKALHSKKEIKAILTKIKKWLDEEQVSYENRSTTEQCLRLGISHSGANMDLWLATYKDFVSLSMKIILNENQTNITSQMDEKNRMALKFHIDKEIFSDPFFHYGYAAVSGKDQGIVHITLAVHPIYLDILGKDKLMHTLNMMWKSYRKYLMIVQEYTHFPY